MQQPPVYRSEVRVDIDSVWPQYMPWVVAALPFVAAAFVAVVLLWAKRRKSPRA